MFCKLSVFLNACRADESLGILCLCLCVVYSAHVLQTVCIFWMHVEQMHSLPFCLLLSGLSCLNLWICFVLLVHGRAVLHMFCKLRVFLNAYRADVLFTFFCFLLSDLSCLDWLHLWIWQLSWALTTSIPSILFILFVRGLFCTCVTNCISFCFSPGFLFVQSNNSSGPSSFKIIFGRSSDYGVQKIIARRIFDKKRARSMF